MAAICQGRRGVDGKAAATGELGFGVHARVLGEQREERGRGGAREERGERGVLLSYPRGIAATRGGRAGAIEQESSMARSLQNEVGDDREDFARRPLALFFSFILVLFSFFYFLCFFI